MSLEDYGITTGVVPRGGWHYKQDGLDETIDSDSPENLCKRVLQHRVNRGIPVGNVEEDISNYIKSVSPHNDRFRRQAAFVPEVSRIRPIQPLIERIKEWLVSKQGKIAKLTDEFERQRRAEICAQCPQNIPWQSSCGECNSDTIYRGNLVRQKTEAPLDKKLRACRVNNLYLQTAVALEKEELPLKNPESPSQCWLPEAR